MSIRSYISILSIFSLTFSVGCYTDSTDFMPEDLYSSTMFVKVKEDKGDSLRIDGNEITPFVYFSSRSKTLDNGKFRINTFCESYLRYQPMRFSIQFFPENGRKAQLPLGTYYNYKIDGFGDYALKYRNSEGQILKAEWSDGQFKTKDSYLKVLKKERYYSKVDSRPMTLIELEYKGSFYNEKTKKSKVLSGKMKSIVNGAL